MSIFALNPDQPGYMFESFQRVLNPIETARGLPNRIYTDNGAHDYECAHVLTRSWACIGFQKDIPNPGDAFPVDFAGHPLLMVHGRDGEIRVFHNVCRHRGRILVDEPAHLKSAIVCGYHCWTYALDGQLIGAPHVGGVGKHDCAGFDKANIRLQTVPNAIWMGMVFADLSGRAPPFHDFIAPLRERWRDFDGVPLIHTGDDSTITFDLACNWKLAVENYCEAYHLPWVHPELNRYSPLDKHTPIVEPMYSGQISECYNPEFPEGAPAFPSLPGLPAYWDSGAEYVALFPNVLLGAHRDHFFAGLILPDGPAGTHERFELFYFDDAVRGNEYAPSRAANRTLWESVFAEDRDAVEAMQRGRRSSGFDGGVFSPVMDPPTHVFNMWIARAWMDAGRNAASATDTTLRMERDRA